MDLDKGIYWDEMWSPAAGCDPSMSCAPGCWAPKLIRRFAHNPSIPPDVRFRLIEVVDRRGWTGHTVALADWLSKPAWTARPTTFATAWLGDLYRCEAQVIESVYRVMHEHPRHTYLVLTKLPGVMAAWSHRLGRGPAERQIWHGVSITRLEDWVPRLEPMVRCPGRRWVSLGPWEEAVQVEPHLADWLRIADVEQVVMEGPKGTSPNELTSETVEVMHRVCQAAYGRDRIPFFFKSFGDFRGRQVWVGRTEYARFDELAWAAGGTTGDTEDTEVA